MSFKVGDIVKHKASFLKSTGWYTNVPTNGEVKATTLSGEYVHIQWCNRPSNELAAIRVCNIMFAKDPDYSGM